MLDKIEIYPYQRIIEPSARQKARNKKVTIKSLARALKAGSPELAAAIKQVATLENIAFAVIAVIMARGFVLGELLPFIFACVAAFGYQEKQRAMLMACFAIPGFISAVNGFALGSNILALCVLVGLITYISIPRDKVWWGLPILTISAIFLSKTILLFINGMTFYGEMVIVFEALIAGVLTFVFLVASDTLKQKKALVNFTFEDIAAFMVLGVGIIMGLNGISIAGLSISSILCRLGILIAAFLWGSGGGTMVGVMTGIIPSITSSVFAQSVGLYAFSGLLAGLFKNFGRLGVMVGFLMGNLALSIVITETQATILGIWESGIACVLFFLLPHSLKEKVPVQSLGPIHNLKENEVQLVDERIKASARSRIEHLASVFEELSSTFIGNAGARQGVDPTAYLNYLYDEISQGFCTSCSRYDACWGKDCYNTSQEILEIFALAEAGSEVKYEECPVEFRRRCIYGREIINTINYLFDNLRINEYWVHKLDQSRDLVSTQLHGVSQVMKNLAEEIDINTTVDFPLREKLMRESRRLDFKIKDIVPVRASRDQLYINIVADSCSDGQACENAVAMFVSGVTGEKMEVCSKECPRFMGKGPCEFTLTRAFTYKVLSGAAQVGKETVCGDSFTIATLKEGKELVALSDGMGVGEKACNESQAAVRLLENLLSTGYSRETALKTINSVLLLRSTAETFATVDMVMVDLYTAEVDFIKVGSAPSFIKRGKKVGVVTSNSLPIGILDNLDVISEKRCLCPRDLLVMVSDGVLEAARGSGGEMWLQQFLSAIEEKDPQIIAEMIINKALGLCKGKPADDMTAICMYIDI
ncbi:MAG: stage II sporulation protein E [Syntrophomonadaceae bacterium]|nr:stage II sporulation protein E [Syntrophomonadaceae bacterium]